MKNLLYLISMTVLLVCLQSCLFYSASEKDSSKDDVSADSTATSIDTMYTEGDSLTAKSVNPADTIVSKDKKYDNNTTEKHEAPDHKTPNEAKLDSIKNAKKKKKKD